MTLHRVNNRALALLATGGLALAGPAAALAASGGASAASSGGASDQSSSPGAATGTAGPKPGNVIVRATGNGITVTTRASGILSRPQRFSGNAGPSAAGATIEIERRGRETGWTWQPTTHDTAASDGSFSATWPVNHIGRFAIRAVVERGQRAEIASSSPSLTIIVYRPSLATIYGPGFWGHKTACGQVLHTTTVGLANRTLPCGTKVAVYYHGRTMVVPVIDRGPYANGADWDLTEATSQALGITGTATVGAVSLPRAH
jgi:hypothetical protein